MRNRIEAQIFALQQLRQGYCYLVASLKLKPEHYLRDIYAIGFAINELQKLLN